MSVVDPLPGGVLVDFEYETGLQEATSAGDLAERSALAVAQAMRTIREMANDVVLAARQAATPPTEITVEFGIKLDAAAGALVAKVGAGATLNVTLTWRRDADA